MRVLAASLLLALDLLICDLAVAQMLPARFEHNRVFLDAAAPDGEIVTFYTDTGGGFNAITESTVDQHSLVRRGTAMSDNGERVLVAFPAFAQAAGIPPPPPDPWLKGNLAVVSDSRLEADGLLGSRWFAGGIWEFDYGERKLFRLNKFEAKDFENASLGFRHVANGNRDLNFPRVDVVIDGEQLSMLLDTGATAKLTETSAPVHGLTTGTPVGTSYIVRSIFDSWRDRHPDWRVVENADAVTGQSFPMIEVPSVDGCWYRCWTRMVFSAPRSHLPKMDVPND